MRAGVGDEEARRRLAIEVRRAAGDGDAGIRLRAAQAMGVLDAPDKAAAGALLADADPRVRIAAFDAVAAGDAFALDDALDALRDPRTAAAAGGALDRLGDAVVPALDARLHRAAVPADAAVTRFVRALHQRTAARDAVLRAHVGHPDRDLGLVVMDRLVGPDSAGVENGTVLDRALEGDAVHAGRILSALGALGRAAGDESVDPLARALRDELDLVRARIAAGRLARYGSTAVGPALVAIGTPGEGWGVAAEALGVLLRPDEARRVIAVLEPGLSASDRLGRLGGAADAPLDLHATLRDLVEDRDAAWRSPWLRACAIHTAVALGRLEGIDLEGARSLHDPVVDELLGEPGG